MSDGENNGSPEQLQKAIQRVETLVNSKKLTVFAIAIGKEADMNLLGKLSPRRRPMRLQGMKFKEFFEWLSKSVSRTSSSQPGEKVQLPPADDWGTL